MIGWLTKARKRGCPLLAVQTPEPLGAVADIKQAMVGQHLLAWSWDCAAGPSALTEEAENAGAPDCGTEPDGMLAWAQSMPDNAVMVAHWHQEYWQDVRVRQGVINLRDTFKRSKRTLVLLGRQLTIPVSLRSDFLAYDVMLPGTQELESVITSIEAYLPNKLTESERCAAIDALRGMTQFEAEQHAAMSYRATGEQCSETKGKIRIAELWKAKVRLINSTPGLQCWQGSESAEQVKGLDALLSDFTAIKDGRLPVRLVVWIDESEDALAGVEGDTSGISQDYLGTLAKHIQDTEAQSILLAGHPGTGKSLSAKCAGTVFGCLVLALDLGACKGSLVGESESNLRHALAIERAIVGNQLGSTLWIWTTNNAEALPHKLRARMQGEYFCDLPGEQESLAIWSLYRSKYAIPQGDSFPACEGWTGREIARCCRLAWQYKRTLQEASTRVVPIRISQAKAIIERRNQASGRYLDAAQGGIFKWQEQREGRKVEL